MWHVEFEGVRAKCLEAMRAEWGAGREGQFMEGLAYHGFRYYF